MKYRQFIKNAFVNKILNSLYYVRDSFESNLKFDKNTSVLPLLNIV